MDYLTFYDGADTSSPIITKLCGNIRTERALNIYSTGPQLTAVFSSQANSPGSFGFTAAWTAIGIYFLTRKNKHKMQKTTALTCTKTNYTAPAFLRVIFSPISTVFDLCRFRERNLQQYQHMCLQQPIHRSCV